MEKLFINYILIKKSKITYKEFCIQIKKVSTIKELGGVVKSGVHACLSRRRSRVRIPSSPPKGQIAQSVEHLSEKQGVGSSILPLATRFLNKLKTFVTKTVTKLLDRHL